jgi:hypothetical protein
MPKVNTKKSARTAKIAPSARATAPTLTVVGKAVNPLASKAMLGSLSITGWSARKFDRKTTDEVLDSKKADYNAGRWNKLLAVNDKLDELMCLAGEYRTFYYDMTQPWLDNGSRVLASIRYQHVMDEMRKGKGEYLALADALVPEMPAIIEDAKTRLGDMFDPNDYPSGADLRKRFTFEFRVLPIPDSHDFRCSIDPEDMKQIREEVELAVKMATDNAMHDTKQRLVETVGHMVERLTAFKPAVKKVVTVEGKKKTITDKKTEGAFKDSLVENVRDLVYMLPAFNLTDDPKLATLTKRIEAELCPHDPKDLRENEHIRATTLKSAEQILADVEQFMA